MNANPENPAAPSIESWTHADCPWGRVEASTLLTCEARLCSWTRQPLNTYSNIVYVIVAILLFIRFLKSKRFFFLSFSLFTIFLAIASALAHASQIEFFGYLDHAAQFIIFSYMAALNGKAYFKYSYRIRVRVFLSLMLFGFLIRAVFPGFGLILFMVYLVANVALEAALLKTARAESYKSLMAGMLALIAAGVCFMIDITKDFCNPTNHYFQFHSAWHVFTAIAIYYMASHFQQRSTPKY